MIENRRLRRLLGVAVITGLIPFEVIQAAVPLSWQGLEPGAFAVGFQTIEKYDHSRSFRATSDYFGNPIESETSRPVQLCSWYPAIAEAWLANLAKAEGITYNYRVGDDLPPTAEEFLVVLNQAGVARAVELDQKFDLFKPGEANRNAENYSAALVCYRKAHELLAIDQTTPAGTKETIAAGAAESIEQLEQLIAERSQ